MAAARERDKFEFLKNCDEFQSHAFRQNSSVAYCDGLWDVGVVPHVAHTHPTHNSSAAAQFYYDAWRALDQAHTAPADRILDSRGNCELEPARDCCPSSVSSWQQAQAYNASGTGPCLRVDNRFELEHTVAFVKDGSRDSICHM